MSAVGKTIADVRADVCDTVFAWMIPAGAVGVGMSLSRVFEHGWLPIMNFHVGLMVLLVVIYVVRKKIPYGLRAGLLVAIMFMIGVGGHVSFGSPTALVYFISASIMAAVLFGERIGVATVALSVISIMGIYGLFKIEVLPPPRATVGPLVFTTWLTNTAAALVASLGPLISVSRFRRYLDAERRRAEAASTAKSDFLATMSHELRTPMTAVLGIADLLLADNLPVQQSEKVGRIAKSGRILLSLLNDLLDFSKIEAGRLVIERVPFSLQDVIREVRDLMTPLADEKHLAFEVKVAPNMTDGLIGDPIRLRQIMINLIGNAIKFTERGRVAMHVSQRSAPDGETSIEVKVADTGIGIPPAQQAALFQPFVQADSSTTRRFGGTGLGLAICRRLLELMGGDIAVSSREGEGATFSFTVPVARDRTAAPAITQASFLNAGTAAMRPMKVLVADDNEATRFLLKEMLERWGHTVSLAENGALAVAAVEGEPFDVVLMDMQMPVLDGVKATRAIRAMSGAIGQIPVLALTADVVASHRDIYAEAGVNALVGKPVNWSELAAEMNRWVPQEGQKHLGARPIAQSPIHADGKPALPTSDNDAMPVFEPDMVAELERSLGPSTLATLVEKSRANLEQYRYEIAAAAEANDAAKVAKLAHAIKGLCLQYGATRAARHAADLENSARHADAPAPKIQALTDALAAAETALKAECERLRSVVTRAKP